MSGELWTQENEYYLEELTYDELLNMNRNLVIENHRLKIEKEKVEKEYSNFLSEMVNSTTSVTNEWVKLLVSGDIKINK